MNITFQADNDLNARIIDAVLRLDPAVDFKTAFQSGFHTGTSDPDVLKVAAEEGRVLVSHDQRTLSAHCPGISPTSLSVKRRRE